MNNSQIIETLISTQAIIDRINEVESVAAEEATYHLTNVLQEMTEQLEDFGILIFALYRNHVDPSLGSMTFSSVHSDEEAECYCFNYQHQWGDNFQVLSIPVDQGLVDADRADLIEYFEDPAYHIAVAE